ncbi:chemotaxis protein CheB [Solimonas sp. SE-A11]|uniref:chemotaxis protein CheB n=1 Tax=Solimonas sp. SE-A11 TaxID=3054954 RepID=UPI00259CA95A|nr:chemotaxis protein CheB [Solimonas sp. SE-A11]
MSAPVLSRHIAAVAIGASAGGVEALSQLLTALPRGFPAAVFIVLHLSRERPSMLAELFQARCALPVREAADKEPIQAGTVYLAPPDYHLLVDAGPQLALSVDEPVQYSRPSIDVLFETAADEYGDRLLGIVLTGGNDDGARGLVAIRAAGGLGAVQDPATALVPAMPLAAQSAATPEYVLSLDGLAALLRSLASPVSASPAAERPR